MHGMDNDGNPKNPGWGIPTREDTMMEDGKLLWNRLSIDYNLHLLYRVTNFSIKVAK